MKKKRKRKKMKKKMKKMKNKRSKTRLLSSQQERVSNFYQSRLQIRTCCQTR